MTLGKISDFWTFESLVSPLLVSICSGFVTEHQQGEFPADRFHVFNSQALKEALRNEFVTVMMLV